MSQPISLKEAERKAFRTQYNDGLWDILMGSVFAMFAIAPYLSTRLGDFLSSAVFLPVWALLYLAIHLLRKHVVAPRIGSVKFGRARTKKLAKLTLIMLVVNVVAFILGLIAALNFGRVPGQIMGIIMGLFLLMGYSLAAHLLDFPRLYLYGLLVGFSPLVGELLWNRGLVTHHGFPLTFGTAGGVMVLIGLVVFVRLLHDNPLPAEEA